MGPSFIDVCDFLFLTSVGISFSRGDFAFAKGTVGVFLFVVNRNHRMAVGDRSTHKAMYPVVLSYWILQRSYQMKVRSAVKKSVNFLKISQQIEIEYLRTNLSGRKIKRKCLGVNHCYLYISKSCVLKRRIVIALALFFVVTGLTKCR